MCKAYIIDGDKWDFFDGVLFCNEDTMEWEKFLWDVAKQATEHNPHDEHDTKFVQFMREHGYMDQISDIIYEAEKAFVNERIDATGAPFDHC